MQFPVFYNYLIFSIFGLIIGSFLNVVILRFDELQTMVKGRSHCPKCKKDLAWYDLVPILSYVFLWGKCRYCKTTISWQYPAVELLTALIFGLIYMYFGFNLISLFLILISCILIVALVYDILHFLIDDRLVWSAIGLWTVFLILNFVFLTSHFSDLLPYLYGALAFGGFIGLLVWLSHERWMGAGDIGVAFLVGLMVGWPNVLFSFFSAFTLGALYGILAMIFAKKKKSAQVPFIPFLILGLWITLFWGNQIVDWYVSRLM